MQLGALFAGLDAEDEVDALAGSVVAAAEAVVGGGVFEASGVLLGVRAPFVGFLGFGNEAFGDNPELADARGVDVAADDFAAAGTGVEGAVCADHAVSSEGALAHVVSTLSTGALVKGAKVFGDFFEGFVQRYLRSFELCG